MELTSVAAIYILFWVTAAFIILPIGIRSHHETGVEMVKGQSDGAPVNFLDRLGQSHIELADIG